VVVEAVKLIIEAVRLFILVGIEIALEAVSMLRGPENESI
jgi:hypothetical protein